MRHTITSGKTNETILIDDEDLPLVRSIDKWNIIRQTRDGYTNTYFRNRKDGKYIYLHRLILGVDSSLYVDHINGNTLDNRKNNLRPVTRAQNQMNKRTSITHPTGHRGVVKSHTSEKYNIRVSADGVLWAAYGFDTIDAAIAARDRLARHIHGEYSRDSA